MFKNPYINNKNILFLYIAFYLLIFVPSFFVMIKIFNLPPNYVLTDISVFLIIYFFIGISFWYHAQYLSFENFSIPRLVFNHVSAAIVSSFIWVFASYIILTSLISQSEQITEFINDSLFWRAQIGILLYFLITIINYLLIYYQNYKQKILQENELQLLIKNEELKSLKYQINPHFIFNSLNSIASLTITSPKSAREMTIKLSEYMRSVLAKKDLQLVPLKDELKNVLLYLDIEKIRFPNQFSFIKNIDKDSLDIKIPSMLIQPLFENAIKHGVYESIENVVIQFSTKLEKEYLKLEICNNYDPESFSKAGTGTGLKNIRKRLKLFYNQEDLLVINDNKKTYQVTIFIPLEISNEN